MARFTAAWPAGWRTSEGLLPAVASFSTANSTSQAWPYAMHQMNIDTISRYTLWPSKKRDVRDVVCLHLLCPEMVAHRASIEVPVALELAWALWDDRERIPKWMPWIKSVKVRKGEATCALAP